MFHLIGVLVVGYIILAVVILIIARMMDVNDRARGNEKVVTEDFSHNKGKWRE